MCQPLVCSSWSEYFEGIKMSEPFVSRTFRLWKLRYNEFSDLFLELCAYKESILKLSQNYEIRKVHDHSSQCSFIFKNASYFSIQYFWIHNNVLSEPSELNHCGLNLHRYTVWVFDLFIYFKRRFATITFFHSSFFSIPYEKKSWNRSKFSNWAMPSTEFWPQNHF